jgi:60 kDa SS-A/Ro ribonucleoprotein
MHKKIFAPARAPDVGANLAGGVAYQMLPEAALAQYVLTGCFNSTYYADAGQDVQRIVDLANQIEALFLAQLAVYGREKGYMKDAPALLVAMLSVRSPQLFQAVFDRVIDNPKMLRNFLQVIRSGVVGRKSLGSGPKAAVARWLNGASTTALVNGSVGNEPSLGDVVRLARPKAPDKERAALYGWLIGKAPDEATLPPLVRELRGFLENPEGAQVPNVDFRLVDSRLTDAQWAQIAAVAPWQMTRMNLNTFQRHGVFEDSAMVQRVADRLSNPDLIRGARVFPYQLLAAYQVASVNQLPRPVVDALHEALEHAVGNVPALAGRVAVFPDVSGSMSHAVTGSRKGSTSTVRCIDVAAMVAATLLRRNPDAIVMPFEQDVVDRVVVEPRDTIVSNAKRLAAIGGGGTACSAPLRRMLDRGLAADLLIYVSDNESWFDGIAAAGPRRTQSQEAWQQYKRRHPEAKLVCIDLTPNATVQVRSAPDVLNVGGFSDHVFELVDRFQRGDLAGDGMLAAVREVNV